MTRKSPGARSFACAVTSTPKSMTSSCSNTHQPAYHLHGKREIINTFPNQGGVIGTESSGWINLRFADQINKSKWLICTWEGEKSGESQINSQASDAGN